MSENKEAVNLLIKTIQVIESTMQELSDAYFILRERIGKLEKKVKELENEK